MDFGRTSHGWRDMDIMQVISSIRIVDSDRVFQSILLTEIQVTDYLSERGNAYAYECN